MKRYSLTPRMGTLMIRFRSLPMIDSSAMMSAMLLRIASRTFWRWRKRSPALRSLRCPDAGWYGRKIVSTSATVPVATLVFPQIIRCVLENHIDAGMAVTAVEKVFHHRVVFLRLLLVTHPRLGDDPAQVSDRRDELFLDRFFQWLVTPVVDLLAPAVRRPEVGNNFLTEAVGRRADHSDLFFDGFHETFVRVKLFFGVAILHPALVHISFGMVEIILE